jgi:uncharacterized protein
MNQNRFLARATQGNLNPINQALAIALTWTMFIVLGGMAILLPVIPLAMRNPDAAQAYLANPSNFRLLEIDMILIFALIMCQFLVGFVALWLTEKIFLQKKLAWIATGFERFRWKRLFLGMAVWMGLLTVYQLITYVIDPSSVSLSLDIKRFLLFLPVALVMVPIQSAFEELAVRGQFLQGLYRLTPGRPFWALLISSLVFALLHGMNKEVQAYGPNIMMAHYFTFGFVLGSFALMDEGLELSIGIHAGNNIFSLCLVSYPNASLDTPSLFIQHTMAAVQDYVVLLLAVVLLYFIFFGRRKQAWRAIGEDISTDPNNQSQSVD